MDGERGMKIVAAAMAACLAGSIAIPANAQATRDYFVAKINTTNAPPQLSQADAAYYRSVFEAIDREDWLQVDTLLAQRRGGLLDDVVRAEYYLHARSPKVELPQIMEWLQTGTRLPMAAQMTRLGQTRGAEYLPDLPYENQLRGVGDFPRRTRPRSIADGTMPDSVSEAINAAISNDDPDGARQLLDGVDALLSSEARAEWRQKVAWSYFIENQDPAALAMARTVAAGTGPWVAEGEWTAGLAAWRLGDCAESSDAFRRAAYQAQNAELRSAAQYWGARAAMRCRDPQLSTQLLNEAATSDQTLYGMLAAEQLGRALPDRVESADFTTEDWNRIGNETNVRIAVALSQLGRDGLASQVLMHQAKLGSPQDYEAYSRLARELGFPQTQLYMAYNAPNGGRADPASFYPTLKQAPVNGWRVDPALAFAHILQESNFRADARSPADAQGLMQITPITVRQHASRLNMNASSVNIYDPAVNLAFGQRNLEMLQEDPATRNRLPKIMAAYNAGLTPVRRWESEVNDQGDPLLYMEAIPYWETRGYVAIVMRNYWMYERQANAPSPSRYELVQNRWPGFPAVDTGGSGRTYLSAGND